MKIIRYLHIVPLILVLVLPAGCGKKSDGREETKKPATQVAARVGSDEITVHQVNEVLARTPNIRAEVAEQAKREILDKLIEQQLARQQAIKKELDHSPRTMLAIEAAKSEILARAYLESVTSSLPKPTPEETKKYYAEHPELFAQRRIFSLEEISFAAKEDQLSGLRERVARARSMQELADWLQSKAIPFAPNRGVRAAEQLPLETLPKVQAMKDGEIQLLDAGGGRYQIIRVATSKTEPVSEEVAAPRIQQFLFNRRASEAVANELKQLKAQSKIEYVGEFASGAEAADAKAKAEAAAKAKAIADTKAKEEAEAQARSEELSRARAAAEAKSRLEAELKSKAAPPKPVAVPQQSIEKGAGGLR